MSSAAKVFDSDGKNEGLSRIETSPPGGPAIQTDETKTNPPGGPALHATTEAFCLSKSKPKQRIIYVNTPSRRPEEYKFSDDATTWTVGHLKSKIHEMEGISPRKQYLIADGESIEFQDTQRLEMYWETTFQLLEKYSLKAC